jgi:NAD(P)-dependent dehydrogenase (short-subunit alcohol dehydrogenase family)
VNSFLDEVFSLAGHTAVVTGGSSGIGKAIAAALCGAGAELVIVARRRKPLEEGVSAMRAAGGAATWISADLARRDELDQVAGDLLSRDRQPDILVNAAGINLRAPMDELSEDAWRMTMSVNLDAPFLLGQRLGPRMAATGWGRIINVVSQQAIRAFGNSGAYGVSKAGLAALTRSQAEAWSPRGVCVNAIAPGFVRTPLNEAVFSDPARTEAMARRTMIGRNGELPDFTGAAIFLASDAAAYVTGQVIFVDGGFSST